MSADITRLRADAIDAAELHAEWLEHRGVRKGSHLAEVVTPLLDEFLRARAANAAAALERETR